MRVNLIVPQLKCQLKYKKRRNIKCSLAYITTLLVIVPNWNQPKQIALHWGTDKIMVVHLYNGKPYSNKKERPPDTHNSLFKSQMH